MESTDMIIFCTLYLVIFGLLAGIVNLGELNISVNEFTNMILISGALAVTAGVILASAVGTEILGIGSGEAGRYVWKGAMFALMVTWAGYFVYKITAMLPSDTPIGIVVLLIGPPIVGIIWGMFKGWQGAKD